MNARTEIPLGLFPNMPSADYHAIAALGSSGLRKLARSPRHYFGAVLDPQRPMAKATPAMEAGTLAHCALLEPAKVAERYVIRPDGTDLRTKEGKAWAASISPSMIVVTAEQMQTAQRQAAAIRALPEIAALLANGRSEVSAFWIDEATGEHCKCRPDLVSPAGAGHILLDMKTCQDASPLGFSKAVQRFEYAIQCSWYCDGYEKASGAPVLGFVFACVEADYPHVAAAYMLSEDWIEVARQRARGLLATYQECRSTGVWPGYAGSIQQLEKPAWI